jgi:uncharacterized repeat protein (TIGR01451 family)
MILALPQAAHAVNTASGTVIGNTATVTFEVSSVLQTAVTGTTDFTVDNKVNLTVTRLANATVVPGGQEQALVFTVTNLGNTAQSYQLEVFSRGTNSFNTTPNPPNIYLDNGGTPNAWDAGDTPYADATTFGSLASGATMTIIVAGDIPLAALTNETASYDLLATTTNSGTTTVTLETAGPNTAGVDVVFADGIGSYAATDTDRDGSHSEFATYTVTAAAVSVSKTAAVYWDPFNTTTNPKAIPGAVITYTVQVSNAAGGSQATNVQIIDNLNAEITADRIRFNPSFNNGTACTVNGNEILVNGVCTAGQWNAGTNSVTVTLPSINAGSSATITYQVVVQ